MTTFQYDPAMASLPGSAAIKEYLQEIQRTPLLKPAEEKELAFRVQEGDPAARDLMIRANLRLVVNVARQYVRRGVSLEDLIEEGNLGLMRAVESFDPEAATRFSTYAIYWVKQSMRRAIINQGRMVRLPAYLVSLLTKWHRAQAVLQERLGRTPTDTEVADAMKLSQRKRAVAGWALDVMRAMPAMGRESESSLEMSMDDMISDTRTKPVIEQVYDTDCMTRLFAALDMLDVLDAEVIRLRFGLIEPEPLSLVETARRLCLTRERVRMIEKRAMERLIWLSRRNRF